MVIKLEKYRIVLASASPRRKEILSQAGLEFEVITSDVDESSDIKIPDELVKELSKRKALEVAEKVEEHTIVIAADTLVFAGDDILGKPVDREDAARMVDILSGKSHFVYTGVCVIIKDSAKERCISFAEGTEVVVHELSEAEKTAYLSQSEIYDKAGAYAIQGKFAPYIKKINGDYYNVVGLPLSALYQALKKEGIILL